SFPSGPNIFGAAAPGGAGGFSAAQPAIARVTKKLNAKRRRAELFMLQPRAGTEQTVAFDEFDEGRLRALVSRLVLGGEHDRDVVGRRIDIGDRLEVAPLVTGEKIDARRLTVREPDRLARAHLEVRRILALARDIVGDE